VVHAAQCRGKTVAVKLFNPAGAGSDGKPEHELAALRHVSSHSHLIACLGSFERERYREGTGEEQVPF